VVGHEELEGDEVVVLERHRLVVLQLVPWWVQGVGVVRAGAGLTTGRVTSTCTHPPLHIYINLYPKQMHAHTVDGEGDVPLLQVLGGVGPPRHVDDQTARVVPYRGLLL